MSGRVCRGDGKSNKPSDKAIAIGQEDMEKAVELGVVPDELVVAGRSDVTHDEMTLHNMDLDLLEMSEGMTAWRAVGFAMERGLELPQWVRQYLAQTANALEDWAALNAHPAELKAVLKLSGQRIVSDPFCDPRWVFQQIARMKKESPSIQHDPDLLFAGIMLARGAFDIFDDLLARALHCLSHRPLLRGYDEQQKLS